jgi:hypothetical protein
MLQDFERLGRVPDSYPKNMERVAHDRHVAAWCPPQTTQIQQYWQMATPHTVNKGNATLSAHVPSTCRLGSKSLIDPTELLTSRMISSFNGPVTILSDRGGNDSLSGLFRYCKCTHHRVGKDKTLTHGDASDQDETH